MDARHLRRGLDRTALLQIDSVNVLVRSHELPLFSRLGPYPRPLLRDMAERRRELFEYWAHEASFVPIDLHPLLRWRMEHAHEHAWGRMKRMVLERPGYVQSVLEEVAARGPISARDLREPGEKQGPWWGWGDGKATLEWLFYSGQVAAAGRGPGFERRYDLPERVIPAEVLARPTPSIDDAHRALLLRAARSHGVGWARDLADYFRIGPTPAKARLAELVEDGALLAVQVEGVREPAYLHPAAALPRRVRARALLAPFDPLVWERRRTERLFAMRVRLELYTPAPKRVHGYYVLPFLLGDQLVGRVDLKADRRAGVLRAIGAFVEPAHAGRAHEVAAELAAELAAMASWLELDRVEVGNRGDLAAPLRSSSPAGGTGPAAGR